MLCFRFSTLIGFCLAAALGFSGCSSMPKPGPSALYRQAYEATDPKKAGALEPGSAAEKEAIRRFSDFFSVFSEENIRKKLRDTYAPNAYFNDTLKEFNSVDAMEPYLLRSAQATESCTVDIHDVTAQNGEYYFRWTMTILFKKFHKGEPQPSIGVTHIRFNKDGKVIFHQDYWDASANLFEKIPVLGGLIRAVKKRL